MVARYILNKVRDGEAGKGGRKEVVKSPFLPLCKGGEKKEKEENSPLSQRGARGDLILFLRMVLEQWKKEFCMFNPAWLPEKRAL